MFRPYLRTLDQEITKKQVLPPFSRRSWATCTNPARMILKLLVDNFNPTDLDDLEQEYRKEMDELNEEFVQRKKQIIISLCDKIRSRYPWEMLLKVQ